MANHNGGGGDDDYDDNDDSLLVVVSLVVRVSAADCLQQLVSEITYYLSIDAMLISTYSLHLVGRSRDFSYQR